MDDGTIKRGRRVFEKRVFFTSLALSFPFSGLFFLTGGPGEALAFFFSQLAAALDIMLLCELAGPMVEKNSGTASKIALALVLKLTLLLGGFYVIFSLFYRKPLGLMAGLSLPPGAALYWALRDAGKK